MFQKICDKCGNIIPSDGYNDSIKGEASIAVTVEVDSWDYKTYHLCPSCEEKFEKWMRIRM